MSPLALLVAHPGLPWLGLATQTVHPALLPQQHPAPQTLGLALLHVGLSKHHQGFVSWLNSRNKPAECLVPESRLFTVRLHVARNPF